MKIIEILLFLINLMVISSNVVPQDITSQPVINGTLNKFERDCPDLWKIAQDISHAEGHTCQNKSTVKGKVTADDVLEFVCFLSQKMLMYICDLKLNMTNVSLSAWDGSKICPFEFTQLNDELNNRLAKELTKEDHCVRVCQDLYTTRYQCVILKNLNNLLKSVELQKTRVGLVLPDVPKTIEIKTPPLRVDDKPAEQKVTKETTLKAKTETTSNMDTTSLMKTQVTENKEEETKLPEIEKPIISSPKTVEKLEGTKPDSKIPEEENNELKNNDGDLLTDDTIEEDSDPLNDPAKPISEISQLTDVQGSVLEEGEKEKFQMSFNRKEINSADGFFQAEDSHFFFYFIVVSSIFVIGYIGFHNKNKILAYALEGSSGRRSRRRPNPARYRKLETNLEEAISSNASETVASSVVY